MDDLKRVYWSAAECAWVTCPPPLDPVELPQQRVEEPQQVVRAES